MQLSTLTDVDECPRSNVTGSRGSFQTPETTKPSHFCEGFVLYGAGTKSRTRDLLITSQLLYHLSYTGVMGDEYTRMFALVNP